MNISIRHTGSFRNTERFFTKAKRLAVHDILMKYGKQGVTALSSATPKDTGETAASWDYRIVMGKNGYQIIWFNRHVESGGVMPAILIQYGHATRGGTYIQGIDYINPAMQPIFNEIADAIWKEVSKL